MIRCSESRYGAITSDEPESENSLFSEPMKMRTPWSGFRQIKQLQRALLGFEIIEEVPQTIKICFGAHQFKQVTPPAHDQPCRLATAIAAPDGEPLFDQMLREGVKRLLGFFLQPGDFLPRLGDGAALNMCIEEIRGFDQLRRRHANRQIDDAVFDVTALRDQHGESPCRFKPDELDMLERTFRLGREH